MNDSPNSSRGRIPAHPPPLPRAEMDTPTPPRGLMTWDDAGALGEHVARVVLAKLTPELDRRERLAEERWRAALAAQTQEVESSLQASVASARREGALAGEARDAKIARIEARIAPAGLLGLLTSPKALVLMRALGTVALALLAALGYVHTN